MEGLVVIPARAGSKRIPAKNIKILNGRPLINYTLDVATAIARPENIAVSTDSEEIIQVVRRSGLDVPFTRPDSLATDTTSTYDVILHAINFFEQKGITYDCIILLQPTSPFRTETNIREALALFNVDIDMVVSVKVSHSNPYFNLFEENAEGFLSPSKSWNFTRLQDCPPVYEYNGAIYIMNVRSLKKGPIRTFSKIRKYLMNEMESLDLDTPLDWMVAEAMIRERNLFR